MAFVILTVDNLVSGSAFSVKLAGSAESIFRETQENASPASAFVTDRAVVPEHWEKTGIYSQPAIFINIGAAEKTALLPYFIFE